MSDKITNDTTPGTDRGGYIVYLPNEQDRQAKRYTRIGIAEAHADDAGFDIYFEEPAPDGRVFLRSPRKGQEQA
jgi:hypothetical protein